MAGGEGGFSTKAMGFDKKEVNEYIANLNQRMKDIEADKKANDEKTQDALKKAQDADKKIKAIQEESSKKISELELQLKTDRRNSDNLLIQIDELKRKLKQKANADASNSKAAEKKSAEIIEKANISAREIIDKANATAKETVEKAKETAKNIVSSAQSAGSGSASVAGLDEFMKVLGDFMNKVTSGVNEVNQQASILLGAQNEVKNVEPVSVPDFSKITAPQAKAPDPVTVPQTNNKSSNDMSDDLFAAFDDDSTNESSIEDDFGTISEVQPLDPSKEPGAVVLDEFDLSNTDDFGGLDEDVEEVKPLNAKKRGKADLSEEFEKQILAQTANSSSLQKDMDDDMLAAVKRQEEQFAVKPASGVADFDMDNADEQDSLNAMLKQAEETFGKADKKHSEESAKSESKSEETTSKPKDDDSSNPWAALQNELLAMEKSGNFGESESDTSTADSTFEDPAAPNADDSSIWNFGDENSSSSDDDSDMSMSADMFGGF